MTAKDARETAADCRRWAADSQAAGDAATAAMWRQRAVEYDAIAAAARSHAARNRELAKRLAR